MKQIALILIVALMAGCFGVEPEKTGKEGKSIPQFSMLLTDSITWLNSRSIPAGKPIALFYFSPYCPYCKAQTQEIIDEMDELKNIQFYFITNSSISELKAFNKAYNLKRFPNITTGEDTSQLIRDYFGIAGVPYLAIFDKNKNLNKSFMGKISSNQLKRVAED